MKFRLLTIALSLVLLKFLVYREVGMGEALVYVSVVLFAGFYLCMELYFLKMQHQAKAEREAEHFRELGEIERDIGEIKSKMSAETLQKGFRLK